MTTVYIQIPCFNEEETLPTALADLPRTLEGVDEVRWLIIDDGSADNTVEVARAHGVDQVVSHTRNMGLAKTFMTGLNACLEGGADIIVNTDADNQYDASCIPDLLKPILEGRADLVIGARPIDEVEHFSPIKKFLQKLGSWVIRKVSGTQVADAPSGFRAMTRRAAMRLNVFSEYTYTLETIIQAGQARLAVETVPVRVNPQLRPSRLMSSMISYLRKSLLTVLRIFITYKPMRFFMGIGSVFLFLGGLLCVRWLALFIMGTDRAHVPSLILAAILLLGGFFCAALAILGDLLSVNRKLLENIRYRVMRLEMGDACPAPRDSASETEPGHKPEDRP